MEQGQISLPTLCNPHPPQWAQKQGNALSWMQLLITHLHVAHNLMAEKLKPLSQPH